MVAAPARHVLTRLTVLDQCAAPRTALPTFRLSEGVGASHLAVLGAVRFAVRSAAADGAGLVAVRARRDAAGGVGRVGV